MTTQSRPGRAVGLLGSIALVLGMLLCCGAFDSWMLTTPAKHSADAAIVGLATLNLEQGRTYLVYVKDATLTDLSCEIADDRDRTNIDIKRSNDPPPFRATVTDAVDGRYDYFGRFVADRDGYLVLDCGDANEYYVAGYQPMTPYAIAALAVAFLLTVVGAILLLVQAVRRAKVPGPAERPVPRGRRPSWIWYPVYGAVLALLALVTVLVLAVYGPLFNSAGESSEVGRSSAGILVADGARYLVYRDADSTAGIDQCQLTPAAGMTLSSARPIGVPARITSIGRPYDYIGTFRGRDLGTLNNGVSVLRCPSTVHGLLVRPDRAPKAYLLLTGTAVVLIGGLVIGLAARVGIRRSRIPAA